MTQDEQHLRLLSIFHYVVAAIAALFCSFPIVHVIIGLLLVFNPEAFDGKGEPPPASFGWLFVGVGGLLIIAGWILAGLIFFAGWSLASHRRYMFCFVMAGIECIWAPFGTVLGVFTIIVLLRESVKQLFMGTKSLAAAHLVDGGPRV